MSKGNVLSSSSHNKSLESAEVDDRQFLLLTQDCYLTQHVLEPTRGGNVLDLMLSSQEELVVNVKVHELLVQVIITKSILI